MFNFSKLIKIVFVLFILTKLIREYYIYQSIEKNSFVLISHRVFRRDLDSMGNCQMEEGLFSFTVSDCLGYEVGKVLQVTGTVVGQPDKEKLNKIRLAVQAISIENREEGSGKRLFFAYLDEINKFQRNLIDKVRLRIDEPARSVLLSFFFHSQRGMDWQFKQQLQKTGLLHVILLNTLIITSLTELLLWCMPKHFYLKSLYTLALLLAVAFFFVISGFMVVLLRLALCLLCELIGQLAHRPLHKNYLWWSVTLCLLLYNPSYLFDAGFQFSSCACLIISLTQPSRKPRRKPKWPKVLTQTIKIQVFLVPLILHYVDQLNTIAVVTGMLSVPLTFLLIPSSIALVLTMVNAFAAFKPVLQGMFVLYTRALAAMAGVSEVLPTLSGGLSWKDVLVCWLVLFALLLLYRRLVCSSVSERTLLDVPD